MGKLSDARSKGRGARLTQRQLSTPEALEEYSRESGYEPPQAKGQSYLNRLFGLLNAAETGDLAYSALTGGDPLKTYGKDILSGVTLQGDRPGKKTYADVLELLGVPEGKIGPVSARGIAGLGLDILLDPTTYVGGSIAKGAMKGVRKVGKVAAKGGRLGIEAGAKIPRIGGKIETAGEAISKVPDVLGKNFVPGYEIKKVMGDEAWDSYVKFVKKTRDEQIKVAEQAGEIAADFKMTGQDPALLLDILEGAGGSGGKLAKGAPREVVKTAKRIETLFADMAKSEKEWKLLKAERPDYVPHFITKEAQKLLRKGQLNESVFHPLRATLRSGKPRKIMGTIREINADYAASIGDPTFKLFDDDIFSIMAYRGVDSVRAIQTKRFIDEVGQKWGIHDKGMIEQAMRFGSVTQDGMRYVTYKPEGALKFFRGVVEPAEDVMYQLKNLTQGRSFEGAMMQTGKIIDAAEASGVPVARNKRLRTALGNFVGKRREGIQKIGLKAFTPTTAAHEYGHALDWIYGADNWKKLSTELMGRGELADEMVKAGREYGGTGTGDPAEMFAEFFRQFVLDNKTVQKDFPKLSKAVEKELAGMPGVMERIGSIRKFTNKIDDYIPRAKLAKAKPGMEDMPVWQRALWQDDPEAMQALQKSVGLAFPTKEYLGISKKVPTYLLPEPMADHMNSAYKFLTSDEDIRQLARMYDSVLNFWKGSVTGIFPAFHARNLMGGMFNNWLGGVTNPNRYKQARNIVKGLSTGDVAQGTIKLGKKTYTYEEIRNLMRENGVIGQSGIIDVPKTIKERIHPSEGLLGKIPTPRSVMGSVEDELRATMFIDRLAKGDKPWDAAKQVITYHFDYMPEGLTHFERQAMKRIMPFYTWTRGNIPLQLRSAIQQPERYSKVGKTLRTLQGDQEDVRSLPPWMQRSLPIKTGEGQYLTGLGLPLTDIDEVTGERALGKLSPMFKFPLEKATGRNFFFEKPISELNRAPELIASLPAPAKEWLGYKETKGKDGTVYRTLNPQRWHTITSLLARGIYTADDIAVFINSVLGDKPTKKEATALENAIEVLTGIKKRYVDVEREKGKRTDERTEELQKFLEEKGLLYKGEYYGVPK